MTNILKRSALVGMAVILASAQFVFAAAIGSARVAKVVPVDGNGRAWTNVQRPAKVFEVASGTTSTQVLDSDGSQPTIGVLHKLCVGTSVSQGAAAIAADTAVASTITDASTGRFLLPWLVRDTYVMKCTDDLDVEFTRGLVIKNNVSGQTHVYWYPVGGSD
jgi:hypothetical protein